MFFGHDPRHTEEAPVEYPHATALDLGAVFGGHLAAAILDSDDSLPSPRYVTVKASARYADPLDESDE